MRTKHVHSKTLEGTGKMEHVDTKLAPDFFPSKTLNGILFIRNVVVNTLSNQ